MRFAMGLEYDGSGFLGWQVQREGPTVQGCALWVRQLDESFHARFTAFSRRYRYLVINRWIRPALDVSRASWCRRALDEKVMHSAAQQLCGEHDFTSFRAAACQARHPVREIQQIAVSRVGNRVQIDVEANGFLYHMVRNIAGSLMEIGMGQKPVEWLGEVLRARDRSLASVTASPVGLYFVGARYPDRYALPGQAADFPREWDQT
jgi:tRNA pseudouridine38-40 synthase